MRAVSMAIMTQTERKEWWNEQVQDFLVETLDSVWTVNIPKKFPKPTKEEWLTLLTDHCPQTLVLAIERLHWRIFESQLVHTSPLRDAWIYYLACVTNISRKEPKLDPEPKSAEQPVINQAVQAAPLFTKDREIHPGWWTLSTAAKRIRYPERKLRQAVKDGEIAHVDFRFKVYVPTTAVTQWACQKAAQKAQILRSFNA
jgi:hypothetical protein